MRGFSENKTILEENLISHCYIKFHMHTNNCKPLEGKITDPMVLTIKSARKNEQHSEDLKISKKDENLTKQKRFCKKS